MATATQNPTVMLQFALPGGETEYAAFTKAGEIITAPADASGEIDWEAGSVADFRGAGGQEGYVALHEALTAAEKNAELVGLDVERLPV